ncbi:MAG: DUF1449 family protein [Pirellulaceae bacterium]
MWEFIQHCVAPVNLPFTILLGASFAYWVLFLLGAVGLDFLDSHVDVPDGHVDLHLDAHLHHELPDVFPGDGGGMDGHFHGDMVDHVDGHLSGHADGGEHAFGSYVVSFLRFFNVAEVPLMIWATALISTMWAVSILGNYYLNPGLGTGLALLLIVPNVVVALIVTKVVTTPLGYVFRKARQGVELPARIVGKTCTITSSTVTTAFGQGQMARVGAPLTLNVRAREGTELCKGDQALVVEHDEEKNIYWVVPFEFGGEL